MKSLSPLQRSSLILLGLLTILFRYPTTSSPIGADGFFYLTEIDQIVEYGEYIMMPAHERTKIDVRTQRRSYTHSPSPSRDRLMLGKNVRFRSYLNVREVV